MKKIIFSIATTLLIVGCGGDHGSEQYAENADQAKAAHSQEPVESADVQNSNRKVIRTGSIEFPTTDISYTRELISKTLRKYDGYVSDEDVYHHGKREEHSLIVRVPSQHFDRFMSEIEAGSGDIDQKQISSDDVTMEYIDLDARINTKKELESRYLSLLEKAQSIEEILEIERQIADLRSDIESMEGQFRFLKDQVQLSTVTISFYKIEKGEVNYTTIVLVVLFIGGVVVLVRYLFVKR